MDSHKRNLQGSPTRDRFKFLHKQKLPNNYCASDADLFLVDWDRGLPVALLDFKCGRDKISRTEVIVYAWVWRKELPVYIVCANNKEDLEEGRFEIYQWDRKSGYNELVPSALPHIVSCANWDEYCRWEYSARFSR